MMHKPFKNGIQKLFCGKKFDKQFFSLFYETPLSAPKRLKRLLSCVRYFKCITALLVVFSGTNQLYFSEIYLMREDLLSRCLGGFTQNVNESLNSVVWSIAPKAISIGKSVVDITTNITVITYNDGFRILLDVMSTLQLKINSELYNFIFPTEVVADEKTHLFHPSTFGNSYAVRRFPPKKKHMFKFLREKF